MSWPLFAVCAAMFISSVAGGWAVTLMRMTHTRMQVLLSFVGGVMLSVALLELLPLAIEQVRSIDQLATSILIGLVATFLIIRLFNVHQHGNIDETRIDHDHDHPVHSHVVSYSPEDCIVHQRKNSWIGLFLGLGFHSIIDGIAIGAIFTVNEQTGTIWNFTLLAPLAVMVLHLPFESFSLFSVMKATGWSNRAIYITNIAFGTAAPLGTVLFLAGTSHLAVGTPVIGIGLGIAVGVCLCVSLSDILPELRFDSRDRLPLIAALLLGIISIFILHTVVPHTHPTEIYPNHPVEQSSHTR